MPKLIESQNRISSLKEVSNAIDYFSNNLENITYRERAILFRVLALFNNKSYSRILNSLEQDFYDNIVKHDLNDILNYLNGVNSTHTSNIHFYKKTSDHVKHKLLSDLRFLFVELKVLKLSNNVFINSKEAQLLEELRTIFIHLKVMVHFFKITQIFF